MNLLFIAIGGGIGALLRYISVQLIHNSFKIAFPVGTIFVNCIGSFLIGLLFNIFEKYAIAGGLRLFIITGFLGGYTTFSAYSLETAGYIVNGKIKEALLNIIISNIMCLIFVLSGMYVGKLFIK